MSKLDPKTYEGRLKESLECFQCEQILKNMPTLKEHLQKEWDKFSKAEKAKVERRARISAQKRSRSIENVPAVDDGEPVAKRHEGDL